MPTWGMAIDLDRCDGCEACVVACRAENNVAPAGPEQAAIGRAVEWMRVERHVEGEFPNVRTRFVPVLCVHCDDAPCVSVCPVSATYENPEGLNAQIHPRCIGTRACAQACPYTVRYFNWGTPKWDAPLEQTINPDVAVRWKGIMEKCTFCVQRIRRTGRKAAQAGIGKSDAELERGLNPACVNACPTQTLEFGDMIDVLTAVKEGTRLPDEPKSKAGAKVKKELEEEGGRGYRLREQLGTNPSVVYLRKVDEHRKEVVTHG